MSEVTLKEINMNILLLKEEVADIKEFLEEDNLPLKPEVVRQILASRKRPLSSFLSLDEVAKKYGL